MPLFDPFAAWETPPLPVAAAFAEPDGQHALADGLVVGREPLTVDSIIYENDRVLRVRVTYDGHIAGLDVRRGDVVGAAIDVAVGPLDGAPGHAEVTGFARAHATLFVPPAEEALALVNSTTGELRVYHRGARVGAWKVGFGQEEGAKVRQGDNRTPHGMYFVTSRSTGPFTGKWAAWFGGHWLALNYPNAYDAARALGAGWIDDEQATSIADTWRARKETLRGTPLGAGIGIHAWIGEWEDRENRLSFGCLVLHPSDAAEIYAALPEGAMVIVF